MPDPAYLTRYDDLGTRVEGHNFGPEQRFSLEWLERESFWPRTPGSPYVEYDGQRIVLNLSNGRWVYVVTGYDDATRTVTGKWPD